MAWYRCGGGGKNEIKIPKIIGVNTGATHNADRLNMIDVTGKTKLTIGAYVPGTGRVGICFYKDGVETQIVTVATSWNNANPMSNLGHEFDITDYDTIGLTIGVGGESVTVPTHYFENIVIS